jgi:hypothetical protein
VFGGLAVITPAPILLGLKALACLASVSLEKTGTSASVIFRRGKLDLRQGVSLFSVHPFRMTNRCESTPLCPTCTRPMVFVRSLPRLGGLAELRTYECTGCREVLSREAQATPSMWVAPGGSRRLA